MRRNFRNLWIIGIVAFISLACVLVPQGVRTQSPEVVVHPTETSVLEEEPEFTQQNQLIDLYERVNPGVVAIQVLSEEGGGLGTGFVWDAEGHILTNYHVVITATNLEVDFPSGFKTRAEVIGVDPDSDLAVLELNTLPDTLTVLELGESRDLLVGQTVVAIGNPHGLDGTMTVGIVSALNRAMDSLHAAPGGGAFAAGNIIQTDAAINPGNSGGPLLNLEGEVVGINAAIQTTGIDFMGQPINSGLGFAVPIDIAKNVVPDLIESGKHDYPYVGILSLSEVNLFTQEELELPLASGVYVIDVMEGSPAEVAGLVGRSDEMGRALPGGDLIIAIDDQEVLNFEDFISYLLTYKNPGDKILLTILRRDEKIKLELILGSRP